jgi:predicted O-linked N-acetylglucosamine transferase (SPINDLY family)
LIDLGGHTSRWIEALNDRCAPLQITWLGYPTTTGAVAMDYRISDPAVDPEGSDELSTEKLIRLPHSYYCYSPYDTPDAASNAPATGNGFVTFGSFNNIVKISELNLTLWSRILAATPGAKLYVKGIGNKSRETREAFIERAAAAGIDPKRLIMAQWKNNRREHLEAYHGIDIALDSLPYNGATTTCEALWMGVPVVSMRGHTHAGRMGASILGAAGLPELIASTPEDYVARAVELAEDLPTLERYRHGLRGRLASSALMDGAGFMRAFEHVLREAWRRWCAGEPPCAITAPKQVERPQRTP